MKLSALIAGSFGITGFVISVLAGLLVDNAIDAILLRALLCAVICYVVGYGVGLIGQQVSAEHALRLAKLVADKDSADEQKQLEAVAALEAEAAERNASQIPANSPTAVAKA